jgi:hypothetical protein
MGLLCLYQLMNDCERRDGGECRRQAAVLRNSLVFGELNIKVRTVLVRIHFLSSGKRGFPNCKLFDREVVYLLIRIQRHMSFFLSSCPTCFGILMPFSGGYTFLVSYSSFSLRFGWMWAVVRSVWPTAAQHNKKLLTTPLSIPWYLSSD